MIYLNEIRTFGHNLEVAAGCAAAVTEHVVQAKFKGLKICEPHRWRKENNEEKKNNSCATN